MIKAILFDLDDTLYPEKQFVMSGFQVVSQYLSQKYNFESDNIFNILKDDFEKGLRRRNFDVLLQKLGLNNENVEFEKISKLDIQPFLKALSQLRIEPKNALYVGDNPLKDFVSPKKIGIHTVRIKRETGEYGRIENGSLDADHTISDLRQLLQVIIGEYKISSNGEKYERI